MEDVKRKEKQEEEERKLAMALLRSRQNRRDISDFLAELEVEKYTWITSTGRIGETPGGLLLGDASSEEDKPPWRESNGERTRRVDFFIGGTSSSSSPLPPLYSSRSALARRKNETSQGHSEGDDRNKDATDQHERKNILLLPPILPSAPVPRKPLKDIDSVKHKSPSLEIILTHHHSPHSSPSTRNDRRLLPNLRCARHTPPPTPPPRPFKASKLPSYLIKKPLEPRHPSIVSPDPSSSSSHCDEGLSSSTADNKSRLSSSSSSSPFLTESSHPFQRENSVFALTSIKDDQSSPSLPCSSSAPSSSTAGHHTSSSSSSSSSPFVTRKKARGFSSFLSQRSGEGEGRSFSSPPPSSSSLSERRGEEVSSDVLPFSKTGSTSMITSSNRREVEAVVPIRIDGETIHIPAFLKRHFQEEEDDEEQEENEREEKERQDKAGEGGGGGKRESRFTATIDTFGSSSLSSSLKRKKSPSGFLHPKGEGHSSTLGQLVAGGEDEEDEEKGLRFYHLYATSPVSKFHWSVNNEDVADQLQSPQDIMLYDDLLGDDSPGQSTVLRLLTAEREEIVRQHHLIASEVFSSQLQLADKLLAGWRVVERLDIVIEHRDTELRNLRESIRKTRQQMRQFFYSNRAALQQHDQRSGKHRNLPPPLSSSPPPALPLTFASLTSVEDDEEDGSPDAEEEDKGEEKTKKKEGNDKKRKNSSSSSRSTFHDVYDPSTTLELMLEDRAICGYRYNPSSSSSSSSGRSSCGGHVSKDGSYGNRMKDEKGSGRGGEEEERQKPSTIPKPFESNPFLCKEHPMVEAARHILEKVRRRKGDKNVQEQKYLPPNLQKRRRDYDVKKAQERGQRVREGEKKEEEEEKDFNGKARKVASSSSCYLAIEDQKSTEQQREEDEEKERKKKKNEASSSTEDTFSPVIMPQGEEEEEMRKKSFWSFTAENEKILLRRRRDTLRPKGRGAKKMKNTGRVTPPSRNSLKGDKKSEEEIEVSTTKEEANEKKTRSRRSEDNRARKEETRGKKGESRKKGKKDKDEDEDGERMIEDMNREDQLEDDNEKRNDPPPFLLAIETNRYHTERNTLCSSLSSSSASSLSSFSPSSSSSVVKGRDREKGERTNGEKKEEKRDVKKPGVTERKKEEKREKEKKDDTCEAQLDRSAGEEEEDKEEVEEEYNPYRPSAAHIHRLSEISQSLESLSSFLQNSAERSRTFSSSSSSSASLLFNTSRSPSNVSRLLQHPSETATAGREHDEENPSANGEGEEGEGRRHSHKKEKSRALSRATEEGNEEDDEGKKKKKNEHKEESESLEMDGRERGVGEGKKEKKSEEGEREKNNDEEAKIEDVCSVYTPEEGSQRGLRRREEEEQDEDEERQIEDDGSHEYEMKRAKAALSSVEERLSKVRQLPLGNRASSFVIDQLVEETSKDIASRTSHPIYGVVSQQPAQKETAGGKKDDESDTIEAKPLQQQTERRSSSSFSSEGVLEASKMKRYSSLNRQNSHATERRNPRGKRRVYGGREVMNLYQEEPKKKKNEKKTEDIDHEDANYLDIEVEQTPATIAASHYAATLLGNERDDREEEEEEGGTDGALKRSLDGEESAKNSPTDPSSPSHQHPQGFSSSSLSSSSSPPLHRHTVSDHSPSWTSSGKKRDVTDKTREETGRRRFSCAIPSSPLSRHSAASSSPPPPHTPRENSRELSSSSPPAPPPRPYSASVTLRASPTVAVKKQLPRSSCLSPSSPSLLPSSPQTGVCEETLRQNSEREGEEKIKGMPKEETLSLEQRGNMKNSTMAIRRGGEGNEEDAEEDCEEKESLHGDEDTKLSKAQRILVELQKQHAIAEKLLKQTEVAVGPIALPVTPLEKTKEEEELILLEFECCAEQEKAGLRQSLTYGGPNTAEMARRARIQSLSQQNSKGKGRKEGSLLHLEAKADRVISGDEGREGKNYEKDNEEIDEGEESREKSSSGGDRNGEISSGDQGVGGQGREEGEEEEGEKRKRSQEEEKMTEIWREGEGGKPPQRNMKNSRAAARTNGESGIDERRDRRDDETREGQKEEKNEKESKNYRSATTEEVEENVVNDDKEEEEEEERNRRTQRPKSASACADREGSSSREPESLTGNTKKERSSSSPSAVSPKTLLKVQGREKERQAEKKEENNRKKIEEKGKEEEREEEKNRKQGERRRTSTSPQMRPGGGSEVGRGERMTIEPAGSRRVSTAPSKRKEGEEERDMKMKHSISNEGKKGSEEQVENIGVDKGLINRIEHYQDEIHSILEELEKKEKDFSKIR